MFQLLLVLDIEESLRRPYSFCVLSLIFPLPPPPGRKQFPPLYRSYSVHGRMHIVLYA